MTENISIRCEGDLDKFASKMLECYIEGVKYSCVVTVPNGWWMFQLADKIEGLTNTYSETYGKPTNGDAEIDIGFEVRNTSISSITERNFVETIKKYSEKLFGVSVENFEEAYLETLQEIINFQLFGDDDDERSSDEFEGN